MGLLLLLSLGGCGSVERLDNLTITVADQVVLEPGTALERLLGDFPALDQFRGLDLTQSQTFQNSGYGPEDVDSLYLTDLTFRVLDPQGGDMSFLGTVIFYVEAEGQPRLEVARREGFPEGANLVRFTTTDRDLQNYLLAREATFTVDTLDSRRPDEETTIEVKAVFDVDVDVL
jgi:hypothetical protein